MHVLAGYTLDMNVSPAFKPMPCVCRFALLHDSFHNYLETDKVPLMHFLMNNGNVT